MYFLYVIAILGLINWEKTLQDTRPWKNIDNSVLYSQELHEELLILYFDVESTVYFFVRKSFVMLFQCW